MRQCNKCGAELSDNNWYLSCQQKKEYVCIMCHKKRGAKHQQEGGKVSHNKSNRKYWRSEKGRSLRREINKKVHSQEKEVIKKLKINGCAICGYSKCFRSLDFHHVNSEDKRFSITGGNMSRRTESIVEEINKCILLCKNCHYEIHDKN